MKVKINRLLKIFSSTLKDGGLTHFKSQTKARIILKMATTPVHLTHKENRGFGKYKAHGSLVREDIDGGPVSLDEIESGLFLGNLTAATSMETLKKFNITYILTLDCVPLPKYITEASFIITKYIQIADMSNQDILQHLDVCVEFIKLALNGHNNILVHCYFGVSRSSSAVIAYIMKSYNLDYLAAFELVKQKRRFTQPNMGFISQLKLWHHMGYKIDAQCQKYKIYRLHLAGEQVRRAKILPQNFSNVIKADPDITQAKPEPIVYRCRKCRRILVSKSHLLQHFVKDQKQRAIFATKDDHSCASRQTDKEPTSEKQQQQQYCNNIIFVEPIAWMKHITHSTQGRLNCPKCEQKLGNFSWINGCQCPCGEEVSPAFYLIPSKVDLSKAVQNVQTTL